MSCRLRCMLARPRSSDPLQGFERAGVAGKGQRDRDVEARAVQNMAGKASCLRSGERQGYAIIGWTVTTLHRPLSRL